MGALDGGPRPEIGPRLRALRLGRGLSLDALAALSGVSRSMLSKIERDESVPTVAAALRIASALEMPLSDLLGLEDRAQVEVRAAAHQEVVADPVSGTTRYRLAAGEDRSQPQVERLVAPPGAGALRLPTLGLGSRLLIAVAAGRVRVAVREKQWSAAEGDSVLVRGPAEVTLEPAAGCLAICYLVTAHAP